MSTFFMMGKYSTESIREMSPVRTEKAVDFIRDLDGEVKSIYALAGGYDLVMIIELEDLQTAIRASLGLTLLTGINFSTSPAVSVEDFDKIIGVL